MSYFLAGLTSNILVILFYSRCGAHRALDCFLLDLGHSIYQLNQFRIEESMRIRFAQKAALLIFYRLGILLLSLLFLIAIAGLPFLLVNTSLAVLKAHLLPLLAGAALPILVYLLIPKQCRSDEYPPSKQLFYYMTLGVPALGNFCFKCERLAFPHLQRPSQTLIVTGLARAGTTALLRLLNQHSNTWSFTYRHMPFLLSSRLWVRLNRTNAVARERSHQDGILVGLDSPEAFDEYFWRVILQERYYGDQDLSAHEITEKEICRYEMHVAAHLKPEQVYLSKNNNFLLRAKSVLAQRDDYFLVIVFREPLDHIDSLYRQHHLQKNDQEERPFALDYMDMLGHHEFGQGRRDFRFDGDSFEFHDPNDHNYWLERWIDYYRFALTIDHRAVQYVSNQTIAESPEAISNEIFVAVHLDPEEICCDPPKSQRDIEQPEHKQLCQKFVEQARAIYRELQQREIDHPSLQ